MNIRSRELACFWLLTCLASATETERSVEPRLLQLLPYPQKVDLFPGLLKAGPPICAEESRLSKTGRIALQLLRRYLPGGRSPIRFRLGSVEEGYEWAWPSREQNRFLTGHASQEASVLRITPEGVTVVGKGRWGMLYGVQTVNQIAIEARRSGSDCLPCLEIRDWPDVKLRAAWLRP